MQVRFKPELGVHRSSYSEGNTLVVPSRSPISFVTSDQVHPKVSVSRCSAVSTKHCSWTRSPCMIRDSHWPQSQVRNLCVDCMGYMDSPFIKACGSMPSDTPVDNGTSTYFHSMMNTSYPGSLGELDPDYNGDRCDAREEGLPTLYTLLQVTVVSLIQLNRYCWLVRGFPTTQNTLLSGSV